MESNYIEIYFVLVFYEIRKVTGLNFNNSGQKGNSGIDLISVILLDMFPWLMRDKTIFKRLVHA